MKVFAVAGEASGDRILAATLSALRERVPDLTCSGAGGPLAETAGLRPLHPRIPPRELAVNGVGDVLRRAPALLRLRARLHRELAAFRPDLVLLVDYPGMNVGLARAARARNIPVQYIAPPQLWAYRAPEARRARLGRALDGASVQVLFPFEADAWRPWAGPLLQGHFLPPPAFDPARGLRLLLCPGSRPGVLRRNLPPWLRRVRAFFGTLEGVDVLVPEFLEDEARALCRTALAPDDVLPELLTDRDAAFARAGAAIAFPGTVTLELFLQRIPTRVWAVLDAPTLWLGRRAVRGPHLALPNTIAGAALLPEWAGTASDFRRAPPELPATRAEWDRSDADAVATVWRALGDADGARVAADACLKLARGPSAGRASAA